MKKEKKQTQTNKKSPKTRTFRHLNQNDRDRMEILLKQGFKQKDIALVLGVDTSTISREKKRNSRKKEGFRGKDLDELGAYDANLAQLKAAKRRLNSKWQGKKIETNCDLRNFVIEKLKDHWSP